MTDTMPVRKGEELDKSSLERFIRQEISGLPDEEMIVKQFSSGASNLTYELSIGSWKGVLRRPPHGPVAPKAHDMFREYTILRALHPVFPIAPKPFLYSDDQSIIDSSFFIMERRHGRILDTAFPDDITPTKERCRKISETMVDTLVRLHDVDYRQTELAKMTNPDGFMERQVHGWIKRYDQAKTDEIAEIDRLKAWLIANIPPSQEATVIHYDYKLNNAMFSDDFTEVVGLFDWEMTTVGDPLADLGAAMSYWLEADDPDALKYALGKPPVTVMSGFMTREEFVDAYARKSGRDITHYPFYFTFALFKLAVICQQIYARWKHGYTTDERFAKLNRFVELLIQRAQNESEKTR